MAEKAIPFYQGGDWLTYRWSVAQVFDTLDRVRELCSHVPVPRGAPHAVSSAASICEPSDEDIVADMFGCLLELCDDLSGEIDAALADLFPSVSMPTPQRWMGFEMQLHLQTMRQQAIQQRLGSEATPAAVDAVMALAMRMRDLLKQIDQ